MTSFLAKNGTQILLQPPYFPDIAPNDFFLFPKLKAVLKGRHFDTRDDIIEKSPLALKSIPKEAYKNCFDNWEKRWRWCVEARGNYFKKSDLLQHNSYKNEKVFWIVFDFYLLKKMDQRTCIKFCVKNAIKCADAFRMLTVAYGEATLDRSNVYRWYKMFSEGREDVNDEERAGRPSTSTTDEKINEVEKMILANRRITIREVAEDLNISIGSCHSIFINDLGMRRVAAKFVPKLLNCDQKQHRMNIANEMLDSVRDDPNLLQRVITGDEAWVYGYDVETKAQSSQWKLPHEPRPKKRAKFGRMGVVHHEFLPQGRTLNKEYYLQVMRNLREAIRQKRPVLWKNKNWLLHHNNAPAHTSLHVGDFLAKNNTLMMPQPPYSPDLAPCDFFLFPKLKRPMKGRRYATLDEIKGAKEELKKIFKNDFLKCFEDWKNRWHKCIISHGDYFEGDKIEVEDGHFQYLRMVPLKPGCRMPGLERGMVLKRIEDGYFQYLRMVPLKPGCRMPGLERGMVLKRIEDGYFQYLRMVPLKPGCRMPGLERGMVLKRIEDGHFQYLRMVPLKPACRMPGLERGMVLKRIEDGYFQYLRMVPLKPASRMPEDFKGPKDESLASGRGPSGLCRDGPVKEMECPKT
ncbi:hypothetical protein LAZ67_18002085, partial [Cordylochernes scorpioides]